MTALGGFTCFSNLNVCFATIFPITDHRYCLNIVYALKI